MGSRPGLLPPCELQRREKATSLLVLKTLWPVPAEAIHRAAGDARRILVVEMNLGQYVREIERILPGTRSASQMDGRLIA
jgi:2-oxoglutarate ferredoxin oxidoreductase subunit alpha